MEHDFKQGKSKPNCGHWLGDCQCQRDDVVLGHPSFPPSSADLISALQELPPGTSRPELARLQMRSSAEAADAPRVPAPRRAMVRHGRQVARFAHLQDRLARVVLLQGAWSWGPRWTASSSQCGWTLTRLRRPLWQLDGGRLGGRRLCLLDDGDGAPLARLLGRQLLLLPQGYGGPPRAARAVRDVLSSVRQCVGPQ